MRIPGSQRIAPLSTPTQNINSAVNPYEGITKVASAANQIYKKYKREEDHLSLTTKQTAYQEKYNTFRQEEMIKEGQDASGSSQRYQEFHKTTMEDLGTDTNDEIKQNLNMWANQRHANDKSQFFTHEHRQKKAFSIDTFNKRNSAITESARQNPWNYQQTKGDIEESHVMGVGTGAMPKEELEAKLTHAQNLGRNYTMEQRYDDDPTRAITAIKEMGFGEGEEQKWMDKYKMDQLRNSKRKESLNRDQIAILMESVGGQEVVAMEHGEKGPGIKELKATGLKLQKLGAERQSRQVMKKAQLYEKSSQVMAKYEGVPLRDAYLSANENITISTDSTIAEQEKTIRGVTLRTITQNINRYKQDPAGYFQSTVVGNTPEERTTHILKKQSEQGIALKGGAQALTKPQQVEFKGKFQSATAKDKVVFLNDMQKTYGKHSNQALRESGVSSSAMLTQYFSEGMDQELFMEAATTKPVDTGGIPAADYLAGARSSDMMDVLNDVRGMMPQDAKFGNAVKEMESTIKNISILRGDTHYGAEMFAKNIDTINTGRVKAFFPRSLDDDVVEEKLFANRKQVFEKLIEGRDDFPQREEIRKGILDSVWINGNGGFVLVNQVSGKAYPNSYISFKDMENAVPEVKPKKEVAQR